MSSYILLLILCNPFKVVYYSIVIEIKFRSPLKPTEYIKCDFTVEQELDFNGMVWYGVTVKFYYSHYLFRRYVCEG